MGKLTACQEKFANEYLIDLNQTRAYKAAYPRVRKDETAAAAASRLLRNVKVRDYIEKRKNDRLARVEVSQDSIVKELAQLAFSNITDFIKIVKETDTVVRHTENGEPEEEDVTFIRLKIKPTSDIDAEKLKALASVKNGTNGIELKLYDKVKALELLGRHLGMFTDNINHSGTVGVNTPFADLTTAELKKLIKNLPDDG